MKTSSNGAVAQKTEKLTSNSNAMKVEKNEVSTAETKQESPKVATQVKAEPVAEPKATKTADQKLKDLEKLEILASKYKFLKEKREKLEKFILSSDGQKEKFTMTNYFDTFEVFHPETLKKISAIVLADLNDLTNKTEAELLSFNV